MLRLVVLLLSILAAAPATAQLTAVWANHPDDKVIRDDLRVADGDDVTSSLWDGATIRLLAARDEVVAFTVILEASNGAAPGVEVAFSSLEGPGGASIDSAAASGNGVFDWTSRSIELFFVRYLRIVGLSQDLHWDSYDERHTPERLRRPWSGEGDPLPGSDWFDRPDHDEEYPEIAVPLELVGAFEIASGASQTIWVDVHVPRDATPGLYRGTLEVLEGGGASFELPVELTVFDFALPLEPTAATMVYLGSEDVGTRYVGAAYPDCGSGDELLVRAIRDRHFQLAHRHRIALIDEDDGSCDWTVDAPRPEWLPRLDGTLFTAAAGYAGPGEGTGNGVYSIGTYGSWSWQGGGRVAMEQHTDAWESWFSANAPSAERFLYLIDEPDTGDPQEMAQVETWASWIEDNPGPGSDLLSLVTMSAPEALAQTPSVDVPASWFVVGPTTTWQNAADTYGADPDKRIFLYNGNRPAGGSFATDDDGVALRVQAWAQYAKGIDRWFFWESTYYDNFQGNTGQTNVFQTAHTFGDDDGFDSVFGHTGWNYGNGDGVLFYPGTDLLFPQDSYGVDGPFASLRLKHWRRGLQDVDYLAAAAQVDPVATGQIVVAMIPTVLWEYGVSDPGDPTWVLTDISWSTDPELWEAARCDLARLLDPELGPGCRNDGIFADGFESGDLGGWSSAG